MNKFVFKLKNYKFDLWVKLLKLFPVRKEKQYDYKLYKESSKIHLIYRISDSGYPKTKLKCINNENCLKNAVKCFPLDKVHWIVICDNCSESTLNMVELYVPKENIKLVSVGHGAGTFNIALDIALKFNDDDIVYFLENDYLHKENALEVLIDGFKLKNGENDYITLYDNPDKYDPRHPLYYYMKKRTHVFLGEKSHWKSAFSTTMTFASKVCILKRDELIFREWTSFRHPFDFKIFTSLGKKGRCILSPIPSVSTHGEIKFLAPLIDWEKNCNS